MSTFVIIGGSSGIGRALALELEARGHAVFATYRSKEQADSERLTYRKLDVLNALPDWTGLPDAVDGLAYCPGSIPLKPFAHVRSEDLLADYRLNVVGAVAVIQSLLPRLRQATNPSVVVFSTVAVQTGFPYHSIVGASKGAVEGLTRSLAAELAPRIRVNCLAPSLTDTELAAGLLNTQEKRESGMQRHPLKTIGKPEDLARAAAFLLGADSGWITGQVISVDGGISTLRLK